MKKNNELFFLVYLILFLVKSTEKIMINLRVRGFIIFFERIIVKTFFPDMNTDSNPIDLPKLKRFIREGIEAIPPDE